MKEIINREFTIKTKAWRVILSSALMALLFSVIIYYCFTTYNNVFIQLLQNINTSKEAVKLAQLMFPCFFVVVLTCKLGTIIVLNQDKNTTKKTKKKKQNKN